MKKPFSLTVFASANKYEAFLKEIGVPSYLRTEGMSNGFHCVNFEIQPFYGRGSSEKNKKLFKLIDSGKIPN